jgi:hypothetical protein
LTWSTTPSAAAFQGDVKINQEPLVESEVLFRRRTMRINVEEAVKTVMEVAV